MGPIDLLPEGSVVRLLRRHFERAFHAAAFKKLMYFQNFDVISDLKLTSLWLATMGKPG
jgi:hypothetical protein